MFFYTYASIQQSWRYIPEPELLEGGTKSNLTLPDLRISLQKTSTNIGNILNCINIRKIERLLL